MKTPTLRKLSRNVLSVQLDRLEDRCLLSAAHGLVHAITFDMALPAVQAGLNTLATTDGLPAPTSSQKVFLGNVRGVETYTIDLSTTGTSSVLTVDQNGNAVTKPVKSTVTFADLTNAAVIAEINTIATALSLTAPDPTTSVTVLTNADTTATYTISVAKTTTTGHHARSVSFSVNSSGDPTGNELLPLSVFSTAIQGGLTSNAPAGATALTDTSLVSVQTHNGVTTYSVIYHATGVKTIVTVDNTGALANLPSTSTTQFSLIPDATKAELQALAAANGFVGTIADTANVKVYDEANGTTIYSVRLPVTGTGHRGATYTYMIVVAADQSGNPTVPPRDGHRHGDCDDDEGGSDNGLHLGWGNGAPGQFMGFSHFALRAGFRF